MVRLVVKQVAAEDRNGYFTVSLQRIKVKTFDSCFFGQKKIITSKIEKLKQNHQILVKIGKNQG